MKLTCPACGALMSLDGLLNHDAARGAIAQAYALHAPLGGLLLRYLALFRPAQRGLTWDRVVNLMEELLPMIQAARIERNHLAHAAPYENWCLAIEQMLAQREKLSLPLKTHGYLLEIIAGLSAKAQTAGEQRRESTLRGETPFRSATPSSPHPSPLPPKREREERAHPETIAAEIAKSKALLKGNR